jgi:hypothetical protein
MCCTHLATEVTLSQGKQLGISRDVNSTYPVSSATSGNMIGQSATGLSTVTNL